MALAWTNLLGILQCIVAVYTAGGTLVPESGYAAAGLTLTIDEDAGTVTLAKDNATTTAYFLRLTPNWGAGMGEATLRLAVTAATNLVATSPRWDAAGTWATFTGAGAIAQPGVGDWSYIEVPLNPSNGAIARSVTFTAEAFFTNVPTVGINCTCEGEDGVQYRTLLQLREEMIVLLGRGNQLANPGPGVALLIDTHLRNAQNLLYQRASWLITERYYSWPLLLGVRLYGLGQNAESCTTRLNPNKITWAGVVRTGLWLTMRAGIYPTLHSYDDIRGIPQRYEIRQCVEVWPPPDITEGSLIIKGNFGLLPFVADSDHASIDDYLICQLAIATLKAHFRQPDKDLYVQTAEVLLNNLVAGTHGTERYVPGRRNDVDCLWIPPVPSVPFAE